MSNRRDEKLYFEDILESAKAIKDFRNFIVHEYFGVDPEIVWDITTKELDVVINYIKELHE